VPNKNNQPLELTIHEKGCRGCEMCVDICPTKVFEFDVEKHLSVVKHSEDCIACLSCTFICPTGAISHRNYHSVKNYYRDIDYCKKLERFL